MLLLVLSMKELNTLRRISGVVCNHIYNFKRYLSPMGIPFLQWPNDKDVLRKLRSSKARNLIRNITSLVSNSTALWPNTLHWTWGIFSIQSQTQCFQQDKSILPSRHHEDKINVSDSLNGIMGFINHICNLSFSARDKINVSQLIVRGRK